MFLFRGRYISLFRQIQTNLKRWSTMVSWGHRAGEARVKALRGQLEVPMRIR